MIEIAYRLRILPIAAILCLVCLCGCDRDAESAADDVEKSYVPGIAVTIATRSGEGEGESGNIDNDSKSFDIDELIPYELAFDENTVLQVSQQTGSQTPFVNDDATYDFKYITTYVDDGHGWDNEDSYNFAPYYEKDKALEWNNIASLGPYNGSFAMYCMYFPVENSIRSKKNNYGAINYSVMEDQSELENLKKSDILGAYHSTHEIFTRIRFRLFHLMTYVRIRLYVPVYRDDLNTGYRENALLYASLDNVTTDFAIDWSANRSSDTEGPMVSPLSGDGHIKMYLHPLPEGMTEHEIASIKYKDYVPDNYYEQGIEGDYDNVRIYDFSVIIPKQKGVVDADGKEGNFADTDFLSFYLRTNANGTTRYYFNQSFSANTNDSSMRLDQGVFQYIQLYVPRVGNKVVFVSANVNPWNRLNSDMILKEEQSGLVGPTE